MDFDQRTRRQSASYFLKNVDKRWNTGTTLRHSSELMRVMRRTAQKLSLFRQAQVHHSKLAHPMTFRDAIDYLMLPGLRLYDQFSLRFAFRTTFRDCLILFHPGSHGVDFIAFELIDGRLHVLFDMGSGWQDHQLADTAMDDLKWHTVELVRNNVAENYLLSTLDKGTFKETLLKIQVLHGDRSKNFDLANVLYLGGLPEPVFFQWREKIRNRYGFQGCFANFSVNDQPPFDVLSMAKNHNISRPVPASVIPGCVDRPAGVVQCPGPRRRSDGTPDSNRTNYCLNQGTCIQMWTGVRCACELTSFKGTRCDLAGTTLSFGAEKYDTQMPILQTSLFKSNFSSDIHTIGYLRLSYTDRKRNTENDEFVLGIQTTGQKTIRLQSDPLPTDQVATLLFVANADQSGDYLHVYLNSGYLTLDYDLGGGLIRVLGPKIQLNDGYYHRIRGFRTRFRLVLEVDNHTTTHNLQVRFGRQFNDQETIWLGHAATLNKTDFYQGYIIESDAVKREASHFIDNSFVRISSGISTEPGKSHSKIDSAAIHSQVNIWLLISLSAAGCIVLCSLIFLAYRLNFKRLSCTRPKPDQASPKAVEKTVVTPHFAQRQNPSMPTNVQYRSDMSSTATGVELRRANPNSAARSVTPLLITTSDVGLLGATSITLTLNPLTVSQSHCPPQIPQPKIRRCPIHSDTFVYVDPKLVPDDMVGPWSPQSLSFESGNQYFCSESPNISASLINTSSFQAIVEPISKAPLLDSTEIYKLSDSKTPPTAFTESVDRHFVDI
ncbi:hypothetical protein T265_01031 [Opisthorchis viverrini]|uniref:Laminin G domain protein n=1 Tax=Opisthorchis viverrini TaxID=6198 RepID=A0A074ZZQ0_OPIVI|nr:hypothetical protein T265_01031 [Opisthorchis viverrini]KER32938.1 hypothetical protein T265_01031 [Opisthorchis viverrini]